MIIRALLLAAVLAVAVPRHARADELRMGAYVQQVLTRNPTLRARALVRESLRLRASAEGFLPDPEVSVMLDRVPERMDGEMPMVRYQLSQMIMWPGKLGLMEAAAALQTEGAAAEVDARKRELVREAEQSYLMLVQNRGYREINAAMRHLLDTVSRAAIARYGAGTGGHHEVARAEVERSALEVEALSLDGERSSIVAMLNALRDFPAETPIEASPPSNITPALPSASFPVLVRLALARRPELKRMRAMVREQTAMADLARREGYPDFMTSVWYNQMLGGADTGGVMVGVTVPIFSGTRQGRRADASELSAQSARSEVAGMQAMIRYQVADSLRRLQTAARTVELIATVARPRAEQSFASAVAAYSTGAADMVFALDAWRALQRMEQAQVDAIVAQRSALADLEWAVGGSIARRAP